MRIGVLTLLDRDDVAGQMAAQIVARVPGESGLVQIRRPRPRDALPRQVRDLQEAQLVALACGDPPEGAERWTLVLLADKLVALGVVESIAPDTVRLVLKKTNLSHG